MKARLALLATMCVVTVLNACGNIASVKATIPTYVDTLSLWSLSGTPPSYPSAISITTRQIVLVDGFAGFDIALDIDANGRTVVYPVKLVVAVPGGTRAVGLERVSGSFENVLEAPKTGFETDSALVMAPGEVVAIESPHNGSGDICQFSISPNIYAKITVDSVNLASRVIYLRMGFDPNCGFRSFAAGIPTS
ncbi:MAG TPA: hypothetical protein VHT23_03610 [Gemmatimonadaceae bacterium]|jgi:hypothetical protein|nr:hypothetical protein [Gemmatimonadaceae bacterium]